MTTQDYHIFCFKDRVSILDQSIAEGTIHLSQAFGLPIFPALEYIPQSSYFYKMTLKMPFLLNRSVHPLHILSWTNLSNRHGIYQYSIFTSTIYSLISPFRKHPCHGVAAVCPHLYFKEYLLYFMFLLNLFYFLLFGTNLLKTRLFVVLLAYFFTSDCVIIFK